MADINTDPWVWSTNEANNQPTGSTTIATGLDNNLRALQAGVRTALDPIYGNTSASSSSVITSGYFFREPLNINPNWLIDQINEGALYTVNTTGVQGPDGWTGDAVGAGVFKLR